MYYTFLSSFPLSWGSIGIGFISGFSFAILLFVTIGRWQAKKAAGKINNIIRVSHQIKKLQKE